MRKHRIWYGIAEGCAILIYLTANTPEALALLLILTVVPVILAVTQMLALKGLIFECSMPGTCRIGQQIPVTLQIQRKNRIPMGMIQINGTVKNVLFQSEQELHVMLQPSEKQKQEFTHFSDMENCGRVTISLAEAECMDLLGLFSKKLLLGASVETLIYPAQMKLQAETVRRPESTTTGELYDQNRKGTDVSEVAGIRDYEPGDSLGSIHWKLSGKLDNLVVREFGYPSNYQVLILYDIVEEADGQPVSKARNNAVLALTAELSYQMMEHHMEHNVGRVVNTEVVSVPVYSVGTHENMLISLLCRPITEKAGSGDTMYHFIQRNQERMYTKLIYITPCYEESTLRQIARELDLTVIQTVEKAENAYADAAGYSVIAVNANEYQDKTYTMVI